MNFTKTNLAAIAKVSDTLHNRDKAHFVDNNGMTSDHNMWLTGQGAKVLRC